MWENYEFGSKDGNANYEVVVSVTRLQSSLGKIGAGIMGGLASVARIDRGEDRVTIAFDRTMPYSAAFADHITVSLSDTPAGRYSISLQITDRVTGKIVTRAREFIVRP